MSVNSDYHHQPYHGHTREHELFATALANIKLDIELGFLCGAAELDVLNDLAIAMATRSPRGQRWEYLGLKVFQVIEAQRAGELDSTMIDDVLVVRAEMADVLDTARVPVPDDLASDPDELPDIVEDRDPLEQYREGDVWRPGHPHPPE